MQVYWWSAAIQNNEWETLSSKVGRCNLKPIETCVESAVFST